MDTTMSEEELASRLSTLIDLMAEADDPVIDLDGPVIRSSASRALRPLGVAAAMTVALLAGGVWWAAGGSSRPSLHPETSASSTLMTTTSLGHFPPSATGPGAGASYQPGGIITSRNASEDATNGSSTFDLAPVRNQSVTIDDVTTTSTSDLHFVLDDPAWPTRLVPGTPAPTVHYHLACNGGPCSPGEHSVTVTIKGHLDGGPVVDALVANFHILSPTN
jgi:hypothetical protein